MRTASAIFPRFTQSHAEVVVRGGEVRLKAQRLRLDVASTARSLRPTLMRDDAQEMQGVGLLWVGLQNLAIKHLRLVEIAHAVMHRKARSSMCGTYGRHG